MRRKYMQLNEIQRTSINSVLKTTEKKYIPWEGKAGK